MGGWRWHSDERALASCGRACRRPHLILLPQVATAPPSEPKAQNEEKPPSRPVPSRPVPAPAPPRVVDEPFWPSSESPASSPLLDQMEGELWAQSIGQASPPASVGRVASLPLLLPARVTCGPCGGRDPAPLGLACSMGVRWDFGMGGGSSFVCPLLR